MSDWSMEKDGICCRIEGPVAYYTVNRPEDRNGMNWRAKMAQAEAYERIAIDPDIRVMVVTAIGEYFITGGRVNASDPEEQRLYSESVRLAEDARRKIKVPVIAAINGHCLKGGIGLSAQADLAIAKRTVQFSFPEILMGGAPMLVMARCMNHLPKKVALEAYYSGEPISAQRMYEIGFLNAITDEEDFWPTVERYISMIINAPADLVQTIHNTYSTMEKITDPEERVTLAQTMLKQKVLPLMAKTSTNYQL